MRPFREVESTRPEIVETEYRGLVPFCLLATFSLATRQIVEYNYVFLSKQLSRWSEVADRNNATFSISVIRLAVWLLSSV